MEPLSLGLAAFSAVSSFWQADANADYMRKQQAYNNKQAKLRARRQGVNIDTNVLRARTEATSALEGIQSSTNEGVAAARVAAAAQGVGPGSHDQVLNTFARKRNQAEATTIQQLVSEMVSSRLQREEVALAAQANMSTTSAQKPSVFGAILGGAANYFQSTYGLQNALPSFSSGGGSSSPAASASNNYDILSGADLSPYRLGVQL